MVFTTDERRTREIDIRISKAKTVLPTFLHELYRSLFRKRELSSTAKVSVFTSVFAPIVIYGNELWVMTARMLSQILAEEMGFLRRVHRVALREKVRRCEIHKTLNVESLLRIERSQRWWFRHVKKIARERSVKDVLLAKPTGKWPRSRPRTKWSHHIPYFARSRLGVEPAGLLSLLKTARYLVSSSSSDTWPRDSPKGKGGIKMNE